ncbi:hypothetical protein M513_02245 [Trichuris suis]|uniref:Uncharacterized protein n=1 Tax=Trichuris suis TaxID=68888 RepID=A0A085MIE2_9BILA|nr:hypothetical protein M513_02245 [Trichuris suis]
MDEGLDKRAETVNNSGHQARLQYQIPTRESVLKVVYQRWQQPVNLLPAVREISRRGTSSHLQV